MNLSAEYMLCMSVCDPIRKKCFGDQLVVTCIKVPEIMASHNKYPSLRGKVVIITGKFAIIVSCSKKV